ncbi:hypothetical protein GCM10007301_35920 [Azorhizobium oxalatiphilum]|uniref:YfhO family protein n=1 Tax=Azorhizobium oxalatiphilum TaxID=980631 RepID=A0A917C8H6_9HYPH|nr:hypothetical protein [Azorhizobium oxalatiphilum]GGF72911.1 hypothetical protein GCM10007301_35920 [Azorhizobium oxalatiphilum]
MKRPPIAQILLIAVALAGFAVFYLPYLSMRWAFSPFGDTVYLTGPLFCEISRSVQAGVTPLMNWSSFEALDFNPHVATYYPFYLFGWLDFCSPKAAAQASDVITVLHLGLFAVTMGSLIRATGAGWLAAICGAALAATLPNTYTIANFPTFITAFAWLPMAIEGMVRLFYRRQFPLGALLLAVGTSAMLTAGPGTNLLSAVVLIGLVMGADTAIRIIRTRDVSFAIRLACALAVAGGVIAILSLASTINLFSHIGELIRWTRSGPVVGRSGTANITEILTEQRDWRDLPQLLAPINVNYAVGYYLLGPAALLLALLGAVRRWSEPMVRVFAILVVLCVVLVFLSPARLVLIWAFTPGLSHTRHLSLVATPLALGIGILAGHGLAVLLGRDETIPHRPVLLLASLLVLVAGVASILFSGPLRSYDPAMYLAALAAVSALLFAGLLALRPGTIRQAGVAGLLALQFAFLYGTLPRNDGTPAMTRTELWGAVEAAITHIRNTDPDPGRLAFHPSIQGGDVGYFQAGSEATYLDLPTFSHYTSPRIYWKFVHEIGLIGDSTYAPLGGKYLISMAEQPQTLGSQVFQSGPIRVYLLNNRRPMVAAICPAAGQTPLPDIAGLKAPLGQLPLLQGPEVQTIAGFQAGNSDCPAGAIDAAAWIDRSHNSLDFAIAPGGERLLVISMPPYGAWQLWVGGQRVPLYNLREQQIVAQVPADVSGPAMLLYRPTAYAWRLKISQGAWALVILALAGAIIWSARPQAASAPKS